MNDGNIDFYARIDIEKFKDFARQTGFDQGVDIQLIYPHIRQAAVLVELGAGYGRAVSFILQKGYEGRLIVVDRIEQLIALLDRQFGERVEVVRQDLKKLDLPVKADAILWLWSGLLEHSQDEQAAAIARLAQNLSEAGVLIIESPYKAVRIVGTHADSHIIRLHTEWGDLEAYLPDEEEVRQYAQRAGFVRTETIRYQSDTGLERIFYLMHRQ